MVTKTFRLQPTKGVRSNSTFTWNWVLSHVEHHRRNPSAAAAAKSLQSCPSLYDPTHGSPPGCPVPGILQARTLEWVAISFSSAWKWKAKVKPLSRIRPSATPETAAFQAPPSMGFSRQEYCFFIFCHPLLFMVEQKWQCFQVFKSPFSSFV